MKPFSYLLLAVLAVSDAKACLQGYRLPPKPPKIPLDEVIGSLKPTTSDDIAARAVIEVPAPSFEAPPQFQYGIDDAQKKAYQNLIAETDSEPSDKVTYEEKLDRAVARIYLGQYAKAISELTELEKVRPSYLSASALGTAFELTGELLKAKNWIQEGIKRNKDGYNGSEWLHVAILQTKMSVQQNRKWLEQHSVLEGAPSLTDDDVLHAIEYQLNERLSFVTSNDPVVADLFFCAARRTSAPWKKDYYFNQSLRFGKLRSAQIKKEHFY